MAMVKNAIFDLDGTLIDTSEGVVNGIKHVFDELGRAAPGDREISSCIGPPLRDMLVKLLKTCGDADLAEEIRIFREYYSERGADESRPYEGVPAMLQSLGAAGLRLMIVTNKPTAFARRILERFSMASCFDEVMGQKMTGAPVEKRTLLANLIEARRLKNSETAMIGDSTDDFVAARANGVFSIGVAWGYSLPAAIAKAMPDVVCYSVGHLQRALLAS